MHDRGCVVVEHVVPNWRRRRGHGPSVIVSGDPFGQGAHMAAKFELYTDKAGKFRFRLKAGNGQVVAVGEAYESKRAALN
ncbi:MAG: YegP family protein, partial [Aeromicrobium sp.]